MKHINSIDWLDVSFGESLFALFAILALVVLLSLPIAPSQVPQGRDSGIFAYTGQVILDGGLAYRDAWDNKPPLVYYVNALALLLFGENRWALWMMEVIILDLAIFVFYVFARSYSGSLSVAVKATLLLALWSRMPFLIMDGNFTEIYALLPQLLCFVLGYGYLHRPSKKKALLIGLVACSAFLLKQTTVGVAFALCLTWLLVNPRNIRSREFWEWFLFTCIGGFSGLAAIVIYFGLHGALSTMLVATTIYPVRYFEWVNQGSMSLGAALIQTLTSPFVITLLIGFLPLIMILLSYGLNRSDHRDRRQSSATPVRRFMLLWSSLTFVIDLVIVNTSGKGYCHYFITMIPALVMLSMIGITSLSEDTDVKRVIVWKRALANTWSLVLVPIIFLFSVTQSGSSLTLTHVFGPALQDPLASYLEETTSPDDTVLVWGASSGINFQSQHRSPTPYAFAYPLLPPMYAAPRAEEVVSSLRESNSYIVDITMYEDPMWVPPLDEEQREVWIAKGGRADVVGLEALYEYVTESCPVFDNSMPEVTIYKCQ